MRRALGYKLETPGRQLEKFVSYLEHTGAQTVTIENAVAWAQSAGVDPGYWGQRLSVVRQFARHLQTIDPACELPPPRILPSRSRRAIPYPYTPQEIATLMSAAGGLPSPLMAATYPTVLGLLTVSGMRIGEAIGLDRDNVDARHGLLRVINSKFGKSREVPLQESAMQALDAYSRRRDQLCPRPASEAFFLSTAGTRLHAPNIHRTFSRLKREVGLTARSPRCRPRLHDLRHRFAVNTLIDWYRQGVDVQARLPLVSTYMGHVEPRDTYWYLSAAPELLGLAARRLEPTIEQAAG
jgi:integrase/recombinase XerD